MNSIHTPGPFEVRPTSRPGNGADWRDIVSVGGPFSPCYVGEALARDADLFAAAPDMLAALEAIELAAFRRENIMGDPCGLLDAKANLASARELAKSAISKAKGGRS